MSWCHHACCKDGGALLQTLFTQKYDMVLYCCCPCAVAVLWSFFANTAVFLPFSCFCNVIDITLFVIIFNFLIMLLFVLVAVAHITQLELEILLCKYSESISRRNK